MSFFGNLIHHPRRLFLRRAVFQFHLWMGLLFSLYLVLISLSGALLVYHDALTRSTLPAGLSPYNPARVAPLSRVMTSARATFPSAVVTSLTMPSAELPVFQLEMRTDAGTVFHAVGDPQSGRVRLFPKSWVDVVYDFHLYLLLGPKHGMQWNGVGAVGLLLLAFTGITLWWRGLAIWSRGLGISLRRNWRRVNFDLHHALGFWLLLIVSWWGISGIYFAWDQPFSKAVNMISPLVGMKEPIARRVAATGGPVTLEDVVHAAQAAAPEGRLSYLSNPELLPGEDVYAYMNLRSPEDFDHSDVVRLDPRNADVLSVWHYGQNRSAGDWFLWAMEPLHFGTLWGPFVRVLWCAFGILLAVLTVSGVLMYWNRFLRFRWRKLRTR